MIFNMKLFLMVLNVSREIYYTYKCWPFQIRFSYNTFELYKYMILAYQDCITHFIGRVADFEVKLWPFGKAFEV